MRFAQQVITPSEHAQCEQSAEQDGEAIVLETGTVSLYIPPAMQPLSASSAIYRINNFLSDSECEHLITVSEDKLTQSLLFNQKDYGPLEEANVRSSRNAF